VSKTPPKETPARKLKRTGESRTDAYPSTSPDIDLSPDFRRALDLVEAGNHHVFVTGRAGTGKTTLLQYLRDNSNRTLAVVAPTGLAAINVGGQTIHSFFRIAPRLVDTRDIRRRRDPGVLKALELLIIDEVSMVRADVMDGIDHALRINRRRDEPFGGVKLAMFGDLWQLPPVVREPELKAYFEHTYGGPYFFQAKAWQGCYTASLELTRIYRQQDDPEFVAVLQHIRDGTASADVLAALAGRVRPRASLEDPDSYVVLTATNDAAFHENIRRLNALPGDEQTYSAAVTGKFDSASYPTEPELTLKVGAKVMFLKNDPDRRWINGSWGIVAALPDEGPTVEMDDGEAHEVRPVAWENIEYKYERAKREIARDVIGTFRQLPLRLGWAITIHKSQGHTFDRVYIDLGRGAFSHGQTYVALSRCRSLAGVALAAPVRPKDVILDSAVGNFRTVFPPG
jgi:hypothetical protein